MGDMSAISAPKNHLLLLLFEISKEKLRHAVICYVVRLFHSEQHVVHLKMILNQKLNERTNLERQTRILRNLPSVLRGLLNSQHWAF